MTRTRCICCAVVPAALWTAPAAAAEDDPWLGRDKALHFVVSGAIAGGGYAASSLVLDERWQRAAAGGALAISAGATKELVDWSGHGNASWRDFTWDVLGAATGVGVAFLIDSLLGRREDREAERSSTQASLVVRF